MRTKLLVLGAILATSSACAPQSPLVRSTAGAGSTNSAPGTSSTLVHDGGVAYAKQIPDRISLPMPSSIVATGGGNYRLTAAGDPLLISKAMHDQVGIYQGVTNLVNGILKGVAASPLQSGQSITFPDNDNKSFTAAQKLLPENQLTVKLEVLADHSLVSIYRGTGAAVANELIGISYTSKTKGTAVIRPQQPEADGTRITFSTAFDLDAGVASADGVGDTAEGGKVRAHWEFRHFGGGNADKTSFSARVTAYTVTPSKKERSLYELSANFLPDGSAAAIVGVLPYEVKDLLKDKVLFVPNAGADPDITNSKAHDFYIDRAGKDLPAASAAAALKALVPSDDDIQKPFAKDPTEPANGDPLADPVFAFPK
jgi:hypothetical protein